jgi:putative acyl-CoA dehydrogenase
VRGESRILDDHTERTLALLAEVSSDPDSAPSHARRLSEALAIGFQASLMIRHAPSNDAGAFVSSRLGPDRAWQYGSLAPGVDAAAIVARH